MIELYCDQVTIGNNPRHGVPAPKDYRQTSAQQLKPLQLTGGKGGIVDVYYQEFAMQLRTHPRLFAAISELWAATYASGQPGRNRSGVQGAHLNPVDLFLCTSTPCIWRILSACLPF